MTTEYMPRLELLDHRLTFRCEQMWSVGSFSLGILREEAYGRAYLSHSNEHKKMEEQVNLS